MIRNFRDLTIYKNKDGKRLLEGTFLRSAALFALGSEEIQFLKKFSPLTVIDLRSEIERREEPDTQFEQYHAIPLMAELSSGMSHDQESDEALTKRIPNMEELYADLIRSEFSINGLRQVFAVICRENQTGSLLWHCSEGKDRCGLTSALFLKLMDFDDTVVYQDYLASMKHARKKAWKYFWMILIFKRKPRIALAAKRAFSVKRSYLDAAFQEILKIYGSFEAFFDAIGVTSEIRDRMHSTYLK